MHATVARNMVAMEQAKRPLGRFEPLRRAEYEELIDRGVFVDVRCELLEGQLVGMTPQGEDHADVVERLTAVFFRQLGSDVRIRCQLPMNASDDSVPEPDLVVAPAGTGSAHPSTALLVVEVAYSSLHNDERKIGIYARANLPVYWLFDLPKRVVRVHQDPDPALGRYRTITQHRAGDVLRVESLPGLAVALADLLG